MSGNASILSLILMLGCEDVFIPDPINPELPKYTETGLGMAGAYLNNELWRVSSGEFCWMCGAPFRIEQNSNGLWEMTLTGELPEGQTVSFNFNLNAWNLSPDRILELNDVKIELDGITHWANLTHWESICPEIKNGTGQIYFRSVKRQPNTIHYILSGTFSMEADDGAGCAAKVTYGRFDFVYYSN
jgi:hypothetical protein